MTIEVLYIHHVSAFGGSSRSLIEMLKALPAGTVRPRVVAPHGTAADRFEEAGFSVLRFRGAATQFNHTIHGSYQGLRWLLLLREAAYLPGTMAALVRARLRWPNVDLVHLNEISLPLPAALSRFLFRVPVISHARAVQERDAGPLRVAAMDTIARHLYDRIIAIDRDVRGSLPRDANIEIIYNGYSPEERIPAADSDFTWPEIPGNVPVVGMVANFVASKGVLEFVEAARLCRDRGVQARFVLVGDDPPARSKLAARLLDLVGLRPLLGDEVRRRVREYGLADRFHLPGFIHDVRRVYERLDVLCFPSYLEGVGRPVFEAAFSEVPSVVALSDPTGDTLVPGETGLVIPPGDISALADAVERLVTDDKERERMGRAASRLARQRFDISTTATKALRVYRHLLSDTPANQ